MSTICPFCDSEDVVKIDVTERFAIPFCDDAIIMHKTFVCNSCEEEGDFDDTLSRELTREIDKANIASAPMILDELSKMGIAMTYLEKALRLPFRTTARWKKGKISHSALALLRIIRFSPTLLHVADENFSSEANSCYQLSRPFDFFIKNTSSPRCSVTLDDNNVHVHYSGGHTLSSATPSLRKEVKWIKEK